MFQFLNYKIHNVAEIKPVLPICVVFALHDNSVIVLYAFHLFLFTLNIFKTSIYVCPYLLDHVLKALIRVQGK